MAGPIPHPDSKGSDIYFMMSQYDSYNVSMLHATLPTNTVNNSQAPLMRAGVLADLTGIAPGQSLLLSRD